MLYFARFLGDGAEGRVLRGYGYLRWLVGYWAMNEVGGGGGCGVWGGFEDRGACVNAGAMLVSGD